MHEARNSKLRLSEGTPTNKVCERKGEVLLRVSLIRRYFQLNEFALAIMPIESFYWLTAPRVLFLWFLSIYTFTNIFIYLLYDIIFK